MKIPYISITPDLSVRYATYEQVDGVVNFKMNVECLRDLYKVVRKKAKNTNRGEFFFTLYRNCLQIKLNTITITCSLYETEFIREGLHEILQVDSLEFLKLKFC